MKVYELIEFLSKVDPEMEVVTIVEEMTKDGIEEFTVSIEEAETVLWDSDTLNMGPIELTEELKESGFTEKDFLDGVPAVVLYPS